MAARAVGRRTAMSRTTKETVAMVGIVRKRAIATKLAAARDAETVARRASAAANTKLMRAVDIRAAAADRKRAMTKMNTTRRDLAATGPRMTTPIGKA